RRMDFRAGQVEMSLRGKLPIFFMYLSAREKAECFGQIMRVVGRVVSDGVTECMYYHICHELTDLLTNLRRIEARELRMIGIDEMLTLVMHILEEEETGILEDLYSLE